MLYPKGNRMFPSYASIQKSRLLARQGRSASPEVPRAYDGSKMNVTPVRNIVDCNDMAIKVYFLQRRPGEDRKCICECNHIYIFADYHILIV